MAGRPHHYSEKQRAAVISRINDDGISAAAVIEEAKAGQLAGLDAFSPSTATAERWASEAIRYADPGARLPNRVDVESAALRLWQLHLASVDELEGLRAKDDRSEKEQRALDQGMLAAIKRQRELDHLLAIRPGPQPTGSTDEDEVPASDPTLLQKLTEANGEPQPQTTKAPHTPEARECEVDLSRQKPERGIDEKSADPVLTHDPKPGTAGVRVRLDEAQRNGRAALAGASS